MARMAVSQGITDSEPASNTGLNRRFASKTEVHRIVSSPVSFPFLPRNCFGPSDG